MTIPEDHPDIEELLEWARRTLPRRRRKDILAHCRNCRECDLRLAKILVLMTRQRREWIRRARLRRRLHIAAAALLLVVAGTVFWVSGYPSDPASELAALATTDTISESHLQVRFFAGIPADSGQFELRLKRSMEALVQQDLPLAVETLEILHADFGSSTEVASYLGVALYLSGDDSDRTKQLLARGSTNVQPLVKRTTAWYLANSCLRSGDLESAVLLLESLDLGELSDMYSQLADDLLIQINALPSE